MRTINQVNVIDLVGNNLVGV